MPQTVNESDTAEEAEVLGAPDADGGRERPAGTQVLSRAVKVLTTLSESPGGLSLAQIGGRASLARSTVHRIVTALEEPGWVRATDTGYRLGPGLLALAQTSRGVFEAELRPYLERLSRELDETVDLSVLTGYGMTFVAQVVAPRRLRAVSAIGRSFPLHCTANGKSVLAAHADEVLPDVLPPTLQRCTPSTIVEAAALAREIAAVREAGVAFDREEHTVGICALGCALPIPGAGWAAISVPMPAQRFYGQEARLASALLRCRERILAEQIAPVAYSRGRVGKDGQTGPPRSRVVLTRIRA